MTSLSAMSAVSMPSPNDRMKLQLQSMVSAGSVKSTDQSALVGALDDIDAAMKASGPPAAGTDPSAIKTKIDGLVDAEVKAGKLTDDQAAELKQVFAQGAPDASGTDSADTSSGVGGVGGPRGPGGPPPPPPPSSDDSDDDDDDTTTTADSSKSAIEQLIAFLKQLEQATSSSTNYTASGTSQSSSQSALLVNASA